MHPLLVLLFLMGVACLVIIIIAAVLYCDAGRTQARLDSCGTPSPIKNLHHISNQLQQAVNQLSQTYLQDIKRLFQ